MKPGRNDPCICGSGKKYKNCCQAKLEQQPKDQPQQQKAEVVAPGRSAKGGALFQTEFNQLAALFNAGRYAEAEIQALSLLERHPDSGVAWKMLGAILQRLGKDSLPALQKATALMPDDAEAHYNLGDICKRLGRLGEAETCYRRVLQIEPGLIGAHINLGILLNDLGRPKEAEASYRRALGIKPDIIEAHYNLGILFRKQGRLDEAVDSYRQVLKLRPDLIEAYISLGDTLKDIGQLDEAVENYRQAIKLKGDWKEALRRLTTPLVLPTGMVLGSHYPAAPALPLAARQGLPLPEMEQSEPGVAKKLRIILIYPPPWQIPSPGEPAPGMPFGPPRDRNDHHLDGDFQTITYGLLTIAAQAMRAGHEVNVYNLATTPWRDVVALISETAADIYGISAFTSNRRGMGAVAALIRQQHPQAHITVGGPFVTALPLDTLRYYRDIDTAVIGEGEDTFMEMLECLCSGRPVAGIPGTAWRNGEEAVCGPLRTRIKDLDVLASPFDYFTSPIVMTSRGCPSKCTFCGSFTTWGKMLRFHSAESCLDIFNKALARLPIPFMMIKDDTFTAHRRRTIAICDAIIVNKMNFLWSCDTRVDSLDDELLRKMRLAGCQMISLGVESGSLEILKNIRKETTPEMVLEATRWAQKYGMHVRFYMILCNRGETPETIEQSNNLIRAGRPNRYFFGALSFFPGTEDWAILREKQGLTPDIFFTNDFKELTVATNRHKELKDVMLHVVCDIGAIYGFDYTVEERETVVERLPHLHSVHVELANAYFRASRLDEAASALNRAEELGFPISGIICNQRACIAMARGDVGAALAQLEHAFQCYPHQLVMKNLKNLRAWAEAPVDERDKPPLLNDSVLAMDFNSQLQSSSSCPTVM